VVAPETLDAVELALEARDRTAGRFDPTVLTALVAAGYDRCFDQLPTRPIASAPPRRAAGADVRVDRDSGSVAVAAGTGIDLGGIGKGLAADRVAAALLGMPGVVGVCVNLGGDLRVDGLAPDPEPRAWGVALDGGELLAVAGGGVATSTTTRRRWTTAAGAQHHHVIDPRTGRPAHGSVHTATVVAGCAAEAEVLATAALLDPATVDDAMPALLVGADGAVATTPALEAYLR
jgi:thiamine biosynthesis lipoprotein